MGRKKPLMPTPRCIDCLRSDLKAHQVDSKLAQKMEEWRKAIVAIDPGRDAPRTGIRSAKVKFFVYLHDSIRLFTDRAVIKIEDAAETVIIRQSAAEGSGCLPNRICNKKL